MSYEREIILSDNSERKADHLATPEMSIFYATVVPPNATVKGSPYTWEIQALGQAKPEEPTIDSTLLSVSLPSEIGSRLVDFFQYYFASQDSSKKRPPYNCHSSTTAAKGWIQREDYYYNPNMVGWGGIDILNEEDHKYPFVDSRDVKSGVA